MAGDRYCEACGADLQLTAAPRQPQPRDHQELDTGWAAGVCDRGLHHERNEDALFLAATAPGRLAVAVCDGVSSSLKADIASQTAVNVVGRFLAELLTNGDDPVPALTKAVAAAQDAVVAIPWVETAQMSAPSCTLVAAAVIGDVVSLVLDRRQPGLLARIRRGPPAHHRRQLGRRAGGRRRHDRIRGPGRSPGSCHHPLARHGRADRRPPPVHVQPDRHPGDS